MKILIVDRNEVMVEFLRDIFRVSHMKAEVYYAGSYTGGVQAFHQIKPDVVVTGLLLQVGTGKQLAQAIKTMNPKTPVILFTGAVVDFSTEQFDAVVEKGGHPSEILGTVQKFSRPKLKLVQP